MSTKMKKNGVKKKKKNFRRRKWDVCISFFSFPFFYTLAYFNKENKHEQMCEVVVIRSAGLVVPNSWVFLLKKAKSLTPADRPWRHEDMCIIIYYYYVVALRSARLSASLSMMRQTIQKSSPQCTRSVRAGPLCVSLSVVFHSFRLSTPRCLT